MSFSTASVPGEKVYSAAGINLFAFFLLLFLGLFPYRSWGQCTLTCIDVQVSLNDQCTAFIEPQLLLSGNPGPGCLDHLVVHIFDGNGNLIPTSPLITGDYVNKTLTGTVIDTLTGNYCSGELHVEDKLAPTMVCEDITVTCFDPTDPASIGMPGVDDNCTGSPTVTFVDNPIYTNCTDSDTILMINRLWSASDASGNTAHCIQKILVVRPPLSALVMPPDRDGVHAPPLYCPATDTSPAITGFPSYNGTAIDSICGFESFFTEVEVFTCAGSYSLFREWEVYDGCRGESTVHTQFIEVLDSLPPMMGCPNDVFVNTSNQDCTATVIFPQPATFDSCGSTVNIAVEGSFGLVQGTTIYNLESGVYNTTCIATDECGNTATCQFQITVHDVVPPVAVSVSNPNISLLPTSPTLVNAATFDDGSWDNCGAVTLAVRRLDSPFCDGDDSTPFGPNVPFFCCDVGHPVWIELRVSDQDGNTSTSLSSAQVFDNLNPGILCPNDLTLDCGKDFTDFVITGLPTASDNCPDFEITYSDSIQLSNCGVGFVWRNWMIEDAGGRKAACTQTITIKNQDPFYINPVDPTDPTDDIIWPLDFSSPSCGAGLEPENLPMENGFPQILADTTNCMVIAYNYSDTYLNSPSACVEILRTWLVVDWCQFNPINQTGIWEYIQVIHITNSEPPVILGTCEDLVFCSFDSDCAGGDVSLFIEAEDDCTPSAQLGFEYEVDLYDDGTKDETGEGSEINGNYPLGTHRFTFFVDDACGNRTSCSKNFTIEDCKNPTPYCEDLIVEIMDLPDPMIEVSAEEFNVGSFDNCSDTSALTFSYSADTSDSTRIFTCSNVGINTVEMWVTDEQGNQDYCVVNLKVQNNLAACASQISISGALDTESGSPVANAIVTLNSSDSLTTSSDGLFLFEFLQTGGDYTILPSKLTDADNGVTTYDMVLISRHILGVTLLSSPYQQIAADVNRSGSVSTLDLVEIRKVILGLQSGFPNNTSWRFIDKSYHFTNPGNPFQESFPESISFNNLTSMEIANFVAVKVGDVNGSADPLE
ncbi:MAG: HYR domain-containing protein [Saprospirales bacterium]|nr:HYR domain-containing protein [Saprospirales bacterium]